MISLPSPELEGLGRVAASILLVFIAIGISRWQKADLEKDMLVAVIRSFVQLIAIGYVLEFVFNQDNPFWTTIILAVMTLIASRTAGQRGKRVPHAQAVALISVSLGSILTLGTLLILGVFAYEPQTVIPIGGMVIGNAMVVAALVMNRLADDYHREQTQIETALALGATSKQASQPQQRRALRSAMIPIIDTTKTVGLIKLPGAMTGMILAGASPLEAVQLQMIVMYMLVGASAFTGLAAAYLTFRQFFTAVHQLVLPDTTPGPIDV